MTTTPHLRAQDVAAATPAVPGELSALDDLLSPEAFKLAFRNHPAGVAVITADDGDGPAAMTATSVISISVTPPLLVFSASQLSSATPTIENANTLVVHLLTAEHLVLAKLCATSGIDRFADTSTWSRLATGEPYFHNASGWIRGRVVNRLTAGASVLHIVEALESSIDLADERPLATASPLIYHNRTWHHLGDHSTLG